MKKSFILSALILSLSLLSGCTSNSDSGGGDPIDPEEQCEHSYKYHQKVEATCTEDGNEAYFSCSNCDKIFNEKKQETPYSELVIPALGHDIGHVNATTPRNCLELSVVEHYHCSRCEKNFEDEAATIELDSIDGYYGEHNFVDYPAKAASCAEEGNIAYAECSYCHKIYSIDHQTQITDGSYIIEKTQHHLTHHEAVQFENIEYWECSECEKKFSDEDGGEEVENVSIRDEHDLLNDNVKNYLAATTEADQINALRVSTPFNNQVRKVLSWKTNDNGPYTIEVSESQDFTNPMTFTASNSPLTLPGTLFPGHTYYWRVKDSSDQLVVTIERFIVDGTYPVRTLFVDGVSNVRDAGGWTAKDGNKVLYGKIVRGGRLRDITEDGKKTFLEDLGIKTELDLRGDGVSDISDSRLTYIKQGLNQYTMLVPNYISPIIQGKGDLRYGFDTTTPDAISKIFDVLADSSNYPIYYHCNAGADRTGSLTYLINGLLGVSYEDLTRDFELTTFSAQGNRFRSGVSGNSFVSAGEMAGIYECDSLNYVAWGKLHELISTNYAQENGQLCSAIEYYLKKVCKISDETIKQVRRNLLGKDVEFDEVVVEDESTVFTPENGNQTLANQMSYEKGNFFGKLSYKFTAYTPTGQGKVDHYIYHNLDIINNPAYTKFHFDVYVPATSARWNTSEGKDTGARFAISAKASSTTRIEFSDEFSSSSTNKYKINTDEWMTFEIDISQFSNLIRFAFYLPYATEQIPAVVYFANVHVS